MWCLCQAPKLTISRYHIESLSKVRKETKEIGFIIMTLLHNYPKRNEMVHCRVFPSKTCFSSSPLTITFKPNVDLPFQNNTIQHG